MDIQAIVKRKNENNYRAKPVEVGEAVLGTRVVGVAADHPLGPLLQLSIPTLGSRTAVVKQLCHARLVISCHGVWINS